VETIKPAACADKCNHELTSEYMERSVFRF